jgi:alpha-L-rhamnosidase
MKERNRMKMNPQTKWIWCRQNDVHEYNQTVLFKKDVELKNSGEASLKITADSRYRVLINGNRVHDGPGRAYPNHLQFDVHDVTAFLKPGKNRIEVIVRYFGIGTFHQIPQQGGLLAQLETAEGVISTDETWLASPSFAWQQWTPKISIQMEPVEEFDARLAKVFDWHPAVEAKRSTKLTARKVGLLTKKPVRIKQLRSAVVVKRTEPQFTVPVAQIAHPGVIEANGTTTRPVVLSSTFNVRKKKQFDFAEKGQKEDFTNPGSKNWIVAVNGRILKTGKVTLPPGGHTVRFFCSSFTGHQKDLPFPWLNMTGGRWGEWQVAVLDRFLFRDTDRLWFSFPNPHVEKLRRGWMKKIQQLSGTEALPTESLRDVPEEQLFLPDASAEFAAREPIASADRLVNGKVINSSRKGDIELCFDMGGQVCGYFDFSIRADEGVMIDLNAIEFIREDGVLQHVHSFNRNGLRYITKKGVNRFTSLKRRSGRYLFMTLRNQKSPVEIKRLRVIESTAPVKPSGSFSCSDPVLNDVWKMSERTLQLCMEDTFTDCPLYEQTLWIGDARNEALYAFAAYGNYDVSARSLELGAQSLEQFPIVGCQVPSSWDCILPAWSFLWGMHVWEHYFYSGDRRFLKKLWPAVRRNIQGALGMLNADGLFSGEFWNLIEWAPIDEAQPTVLHNNMLLVGALRAAEQCAGVLNDKASEKQMAAARKKLVRAIHKTWDDQKNAYPDSIRKNGKPSPKNCQHTSMFPVMFDMIPKGRKEILRQNLLHPPQGMTTVSAPFAMQFMYEALEILGEPDAILGSIRKSFRPMIAAGADTVWETFPGSTCSPKGFPTRSHCHAWSSSPIWFFNRIILGIRQTEPGGKAFEISPWLGGLKSAWGSMATPKGPVSVDWRRDGEALLVEIAAPAGVRLEFKTNSSLSGLTLHQKMRKVI